jgi:phosphoribosyl 1,2-cyclic phosphodiesterase
MKVKFYGTRGSIATPGRGTTGYGGNTTCLGITSSDGDKLIVDAGTGIKELGNELMGQEGREVDLLFTHYHSDHTQGFPFFVPAYVPGWNLNIYGNGKGAENALREQQNPELGNFPLSIDNMGSTMNFNHISNEGMVLENGLRVEAMFHNAHPQGMTSYKFIENDKVVVFTGDYEHDFGESDEKMLKWIEGANLVVMDAQYTPEEYPSKKGWGHSQIEQACELASHAGVKRVYLTHHDPGHDDDQVKEMELRARRHVELTLDNKLTTVFSAREGNEIEVF